MSKYHSKLRHQEHMVYVTWYVLCQLYKMFSQNQAQMVATRRTMPVKKIRTTSMATPVNADSGTSLSQIAILAQGRSYFKVV